MPLLDMISSDYANLPGIPPPGVIPNFEHPQNRVTVEYVGVGICLGFALVFWFCLIENICQADNHKFVGLG